MVSKITKIKKIIPVVILFSMMGCKTPTEKLPVPATTTSSPTEKLLGISMDYDKSEITITLVSNGCTTKKDFKVEIQQQQLIVTRLRRDECKALAEPVHFIWTFKEVGIEANNAFKIANNFIANPLISN